MFTVMPPQETGIVTTNDYADPRMWAERHHELELGAVGTGVAIGDYDDDGRPDIFVVSKTESCRLFRNLGNWKFEDVTARAGVGDAGEAAAVWKQGATFVDVNNDGRLDLYVCRFGAPNLLYVNQGDGTFREEAAARGLAVTDASVAGAFCDYDRDGWIDVYLETNLLDAAAHPKGQRDYLFHNNGDGTFTDVTARAGVAGETQGHSATWWDYDNDGWPDLYVANDFDPPDALYHNNRDGTFTNVLDRVVPHTPFSSMGTDLGDVNNDGLIDFFVADMAATTHEKDQRTMAATRAQTVDLPDGATTAPQYQRNALYLNTGTGRCREAAFLAGLAATDWTWSVRFEDLDNDGRLDLFVTNGMFRESHNTDLIDRMRMAESLAQKVRIERASPELREANLAFRNRGDLQFENVGAAWGLDEKGVSFGAAFGDLDGDGDLDLVYANYQKGVTVLRNDADTGHRLIVALRGTRSNRFGVGATVHLESAAGPQVRQLVIARGVLSSSEPVLHFGLGADNVIQRLVVDWPSGARQEFTNLAADRKLTIMEPADATRRDRRAEPTAAQFAEVGAALNLAQTSREMRIDETGQNPLLPDRLNRRGPAVAAGDLTGDGRDDVVLGGTASSPARVLVAQAGGPFAAGDTEALAADGTLDDGPVLLFDADGDGTEDLLVTKGGVARLAGSPEYQPRLLLNDGRGGFAPAPAGALPAMAWSVGAVAAADFDRSGRLGLFVGGRVVPGLYPYAPRSALLANRGGRFEDVTEALAPALRKAGMVTAALWSDVDGDGWPDLLVAAEWGGVKCFHNEQGRGFADWSERLGFAAAGTGWWNSIATADFNGDGRPDYAVGNLGLNTQYRADAAHPALLFSGDFNGDGGTELIEAYYEGDKLYPWRTRKDLGAAIPAILKRYPRNDNYARATLEEILGADKLADADRFAATELRSGVLMSAADGTYRFEPLPRIAQIAPINGIVAGDFDGDGNADLYAVQNSFAPIPAVGRFDGGLSQLLRGDGRGHFAAVAPAASGLVVPGDAKAVAVLELDGDGWPDFLVTRNDGTTLAWRNGGVAGNHALGVRLRGPGGNPTAAGARVQLRQADGTVQSAEICAGSGYYSESAAACWFGWRETNPPRTITVRWPTGATTEHAVAPGAATVILSPDGS
ncbi:MAG TPA: FG-GAP-like repeat-containing protein [Opitutus sp.]|nr:FG-GAP-like repeat-containing protein [Opitutus sp.]